MITHHLTAAPKPPQPPGQPRTALDVITAFHDTIHTTIRADWLRVHLDETLEDSQEVPLTRCLRPWSRDQFHSLWLGQGVWYRPRPALPGRRSGLAVNLDVTRPVPVGPYTAAQ